MPMRVPEHFGTNETGGQSQEYCRFCYRDGAFTAHISMDEMIELCAGFVDQWNTPDDRTFTREDAISLMKKHFPQLKRWAKKKTTENEYHKAVNRVVDYIDRHLADPVDLELLAGVANLSTFHFHRIFRSIIGENIGEYVQRLRLENAALKLRTTPMLIEDIAGQTGYQSVQSLSKAFKKQFGVAPSAYRHLAGNNIVCYKPTPGNHEIPIPEVRTIGDLKYVYIRIIDVYGSPVSYNIAWGKLYSFAQENHLLNEQTGYLGLSFDDPTITAPNRCRFYACITTDRDVKPQGEFGVQTIKGGQYAVFTLKGSYSGLMNLYNGIYSQWLPESGYRLRNSVSFEKYLNSSETVTEEDLLTEVYIPIEIYS
jgi:AraC family transcriptional regulator